VAIFGTEFSTNILGDFLNISPHRGTEYLTDSISNFFFGQELQDERDFFCQWRDTGWVEGPFI